MNKPLLSCLNGQPQSRIPVWYMRQAGRYLPEYRETRSTAGTFLDLCYNSELATEVSLQPIARYNLDGVILFSDILVVPHALGREVDYIEGQGPILDKMDNTVPLPKYNKTRFLSRLSPVFKTLEALAIRAPNSATLIGFAGAPWTIATYMIEGGSSKDFAKTKAWTYTDPDSFQGLIDYLVTATADYLVAQVQAGAEVLQLFDSWAGVLSEQHLDRWSIKPVERIIGLVKESCPHIPIIVFPKGVGIQYTSYLGINGLSCLSLDPSVPLQWARNNIQKHVVIQGNLDPQLLVSGGQSMIYEADRILETFSDQPFIFNLGHGIVPQTPPHHVSELTQYIRGWKA